MIFVLQNLQTARISYLGAQGNLPMGIAMLFAAIGGVLIVAIPGTGRIIQLRRVARRSAESSLPGPPAPPVDQTKTATRADDRPVGPGARLNGARVNGQRVA
jgi:hypothetical protein